MFLSCQKFSLNAPEDPKCKFQRPGKCAFSNFIILVLSFEEETGQKRTHIVDKIKLAVTGCNLGDRFAANCRGTRIMPPKCSRKCSVDKKQVSVVVSLVSNPVSF